LTPPCIYLVILDLTLHTMDIKRFCPASLLPRLPLLQHQAACAGGRVLTKKLNYSIKAPVLEEAARFEHRLQMGSKPIFHLEAFAAKVMAVYKKWSMEYMELLEAMDE